MHAHPDYKAEFDKFWRGFEPGTADFELQMQPFRPEPSLASLVYDHGAQLIRGIVERMPGFKKAAAASTTMPEIYISRNKVESSGEFAERTEQPSVAYYGFEQEVRH